MCILKTLLEDVKVGVMKKRFQYKIKKIKLNKHTRFNVIGSRNIGCANDVITLQIEIDLSGTFASADAYFQSILQDIQYLQFY